MVSLCHWRTPSVGKEGQHSLSARRYTLFADGGRGRPGFARSQSVIHSRRDRGPRSAAIGTSEAREPTNACELEWAWLCWLSASAVGVPDAETENDSAVGAETEVEVRKEEDSENM